MARPLRFLSAPVLGGLAAAAAGAALWFERDKIFPPKAPATPPLPTPPTPVASANPDGAAAAAAAMPASTTWAANPVATPFVEANPYMAIPVAPPNLNPDPSSPLYAAALNASNPQSAVSAILAAQTAALPYASTLANANLTMATAQPLASPVVSASAPEPPPAPKTFAQVVEETKAAAATQTLATQMKQCQEYIITATLAPGVPYASTPYKLAEPVDAGNFLLDLFNQTGMHVYSPPSPTTEQDKQDFVAGLPSHWTLLARWERPTADIAWDRSKVPEAAIVAIANPNLSSSCP